jgi:5-formyltetrahydrofolate cyclo-ligase
MPSSSKSIYRRRFRAALENQDRSSNRRRSLAACARFRSEECWRDARSILIYLSFGDELDADPLIESALEEGKQVYVPRVEEERQLTFLRLNSLNDRWDMGHFGIREPRPGMPTWTPLSSPGPALVVVPGLAFDSAGRRLGRGGGYYDRFIARTRLEARAAEAKPPLFIGLIFDFQITEEIPVESNDEVLDGWVTDKRSFFAETGIKSPDII